jgi:hypothetical protein
VGNGTDVTRSSKSIQADILFYFISFFIVKKPKVGEERGQFPFPSNSCVDSASDAWICGSAERQSP